jgi:Ca2+-transporting ATPase
MKWFNTPVEEVAKRLKTDSAQGLTGSEAVTRLAQYGPNELSEGKTLSPYLLFLIQFKNPMLIILMIGAVFSAIGGHLLDAIAIVIIVFANAIITFAQELGARKSLESLRKMGAPQATVLRDSNWQELPVSDVVPGDILKLLTGNVVGADLRLIESNQLQIDESALTGESEPVEKTPSVLHGTELGIGDRLNMAFMSTIVTGGNGMGVVVETGMNTEVGHIANLMQTAETVKTPMQRRLETVSHALIGVAVAAVALVVGIGLYNGADWAIPEGLPTILTIVLTLGARQMARGNALVRQLASVETLGSTTVICSDKTGTLTQNQMQVVAYWSGGKTYRVMGKGFEPKGRFLDEEGQEPDLEKTPDLKYGLVISAVCNDAQLQENDGRYTIQGNPTEGALVVVAAKAGIYKKALFDEGLKLLKSFPFDSTRKMASAIVRGPKGRYFLIAEGAPDVLLKRSARIHWNGEDIELDDQYRARVDTAISDFGSRALRTLALAFVELTEDELERPQEEHETDLVFLAIHGIIDPPRPEAVEAVGQCLDAGIRTIMITGDHAATAAAIATELGIRKSKTDLVFTGPDLEEMSDRELRENALKTSVFARVSPEHKQRIVKALQANNQIVAMTGDGVNDAPALRNADIGVAMGIAGTQVAKDSADLVLLDDNFATIVTAVQEGRRIYDNIRKYLREALTANVAEVSAVLFAFLLMGDDPIVPLTALMILWINLIADAFPSLCLAWEKSESDLMTRNPRLRNESIFADGLSSKIIIRGLVHGWVIYAMFTFFLSRGYSIDYAQSVAYVVLIFLQNFHLLDARTFTSIYRSNFFENRLLVGVMVGTTTFSILMLYLPFGQAFLGAEAIQWKHLIMSIAIAALPTFILSGIKEIFNIRWL